MASKVFYVVGILTFYIFLSIFLTYLGVSFQAMGGFDFSAETTPELDPATSIVSIGSVFSVLIGIFSFSIAGMPFWINIILWLPAIAMIVLIYELIRGV